MMKPSFYIKRNGNDNWDVWLLRATHTGVRVDDYPIAQEFPERDDALAFSQKMEQGVDLIAQALFGDEDHRSEDDITLIFSF